MSAYGQTLLNQNFLEAYWDSSGTLFRNLAQHIISSTSAMGILRIRRLSNNLISNRIGSNKLPLTTIPFS
jgi:hypothetical protein